MANILNALLIVLVGRSSISGFPNEPKYRNTIFGDEQLEGGPFEHLNSLNRTLLRNVNNPYRLPHTTWPHHYNVKWTFDMVELSFKGEVTIQLYATQENVTEIVIHAHDMDITSLSLMYGDADIVTTWSQEALYHFLRVRLVSGYLEYDADDKKIYSLIINFAAPLRNDDVNRREMTGLYRNWFRNHPDETERWMASTHFQATAARFAFPCYDEPSFKATFNVTITRPVGYKSWFCTKPIGTTNSSVEGFEDDEYTTTPVMSTYLLALIVAEYETKPLEIDGEVKYEVIGRPTAMNDNQGDYAFDIGQKLLAEMSNHTDLDFYEVNSNIKMTQAAIPDFSAGAMENWGLLVYREAYLMYSEEHTNSYYKQLIAYILSHEIAHMWFGNLVTCDWWDNLWLNEGFARYYQYFLTDWVDRELGLADRFIPEQVHTALLTDSANNPHPLTNPGLGSPVEVRTMFTQISYNKGAAVIRMTEHLMGFENHREGLRRYLKNRRFDTALPIHLFEALQEAANDTNAISIYGEDFNIIDYYKTWSEQGGHPVIFVQVNHQTGQMTIYQRRFNINSGYTMGTRNWIIPITFATASLPDFQNTKPSHIIKEGVTIVQRGSVGEEWVIFNKQQTGFYRVNYDDYTWDLITMALRSSLRTQIHEYNRAQIVDDVFQFARSGLMSYTKAFNILSFLKNETEYTPWLAAINGFNWIRNRVTGTPLEEEINNLFIDWASPLMNSLNYEHSEDETFMRSYLRYQLAPVMCQLGVKECVDTAQRQFQELMATPSKEVPVDSRVWVYCNALRSGSVENFDLLLQRFHQHNVYNEKIQILSVLGCTNNQDALFRFLDLIVTDNYDIRRQDYTTAFNSAITGNTENAQLVFAYIKQPGKLQAVTKAFNSMETPLSYISSRLRNEQEVDEFRQWATENQAELGANFRSIYNAASTSLNSFAWATSVEEDMQSYLDAGDTPATSSTAAPTIAPTVPTETVPEISEPTTPGLPDTANTSVVSVVLLILAAALHVL